MKIKKVLLVIAHPDDEAMFFSPLLLTTLAVSILCLSTGNYAGLGQIRRQELLLSADNYNISREQVHVVDHELLQDGMSNNWPAEVVRDVVLGFLQKHEFETVVTFDEYGVSGHPNHIMTHRGVVLALQQLRISNTDHANIVGLKLHSTNVLRKFLGLIDLPLSCFFAEHIAINFNLFRVIQGMAAHKSQNVWYRILFVIFARYSYVNTFTKL